MPKIRITTTDGSSMEFDLESGRARIGRAQDNDLVVPDGSVSSYHGEIIVTDGGIEIHDLGSTNGTIVNGQRVERADIAPGGTFRLGSCEAVLVGEAGAVEYSDESSGEDESAVEPATTSSASSWSSSAATNTAAPITGLGMTAAPAHLRKGFGPKVKKKDGGGMLMMLGVVSLIVVAAGAFMILRMGA